jgi:alkylation response protein AidB-like acyl-CoA dehydrogenase
MTGVGAVSSAADHQKAFRGWIAEHTAELSPYRGLEPPDIEAAFDRNGGLLRMLHDAGWSRWGWPQDAGGHGGDACLRGALYEELCAAGLPIPEAMLSLETIGPALQTFAPALLAEFLQAKLAGDEVWCQGFSEPEAGSDLAALRLRALDAGDHWIINGQKTWSSFGHLAKRCVLLARTGGPDSGHRGLTMLFVDLDVAGVTVRPIRAATGRNEFAEIFFDGARVPKERLVGEVGGGWSVAMHLLQWERGMYAWQRQAWLHGRLGQLLSSAAEAGPSAAAAVGEAYELLVALRSKCGETLRRLAAGENPGPEISVDKVLLATAEQAVLELARRLLHPVFAVGGESEAGHWRSEWFYSRAASVYGGSAEMQRTILAERLLKLPREPAGGR